MNEFEPIDGTDNYCGTSYAAKLLGVSVGTIQIMVEKNELKAWKTQGGHRRISISSIAAFQQKQGVPCPLIEARANILRVLLVEDDPVTREMLSSFCNRSSAPVDCTVMSSGLEALLDIAGLKPDLLVTDLAMPSVDGFALLRILQQNPQFRQMTILVLSALTPSEIEAKGGVPAGVILMAKPINAAWFHGFLTALQIAKSTFQDKSTKFRKSVM